MDVYLFPAWIWICPCCVVVMQSGGFGYLLNFVEDWAGNLKVGSSLGGMVMLQSLLEEMLDSWVASNLVDSPEPRAMTTIFTILSSIIPIETWIEFSDVGRYSEFDMAGVLNMIILGVFNVIWRGNIVGSWCDMENIFLSFCLTH